jgi:hypothetical protein
LSLFHLLMLSYGSSSNPNPTLQSIQFSDGTIQRSASTLEDLHIKKKLRTDDDSIFYKNVTIQGKLTVAGAIDFQSSTIPDTSQQYVNEQLATLHTLLGWNPTDQKWIYSNTSNSSTTNLDYRLHQFFTDYYRKTEIDTLLFDLHGTEYYTGSSGNQYEDPNTGLAYGGKMTAIPTGVSFIIPPQVGSMDTIFVIQNSSYGAGKVLTSNADGVATWQNPAEIIAPNIQHISTNDGQTNIPAFDIVDSSQPTHYLQFLPNASNLSSLGAYLSKDVHEIGDAVIRATSNLTITSGTGSGIVKPAGIRFTSSSQGEVTIFGGWGPGTTVNTQMYDSGYTGTYSGTNIQLSDGNINMVHDQNRAINLYGNVVIHQKVTGEPFYNLNTYTIPALLDIHGTTITNALKLQTTTTPVVNYIWTCNNADGSGHWAAPAASSSISTFTDDVTFQGNIVSVGNITANSNLNTLGDLSVQQNLTANGNINVNGELNMSDLGYSISDITLPSFSSPAIDEDTCQRIILFATSSQGPLTENRFYANRYYFLPCRIRLGSVNVPAKNTSAFTFQRSIFFQHNWCGIFPDVDRTEESTFTYSIERCIVHVHNETRNTHEATTLLDGMVNYKSRKVTVDYKKYKSGLIGSNEVANNDGFNFQVCSHRFEIDRFEFTFLPEFYPDENTYTIEVQFEFRFLAVGSTVNNRIDNQYVTSIFDPFVVSLGGPVYTLGRPGANLVNRTTSHINNNETWLNWQYDSRTNQISTAFSYSRYKNVIWTKQSVTMNYYAFRINSSNIPVETFNVPSTITNEAINYHRSDKTNPQTFISSTSNKKFKIARIDVTQLNVKNPLNVQNVVNCFGIGTRRGRPSAPPSSLLISEYGMWNTESENACNFYWTGSKLETWVDWTLVTSVSPNVSDHRLKHNLSTLSNDYMERLASLPLFSYSLQLDIPNSSITNHHIGFLAHQLQEMFPEHPHLVSGTHDEINEDGKPIYQLINYNELTVVLLKACQELQKENLKKARKMKKLENNLLALSYSINLAFVPMSFILIFIVITLVTPNFLESLHLEALFRFWF